MKMQMQKEIQAMNMRMKMCERWLHGMELQVKQIGAKMYEHAATREKQHEHLQTQVSRIAIATMGKKKKLYER